VSLPAAPPEQRRVYLLLTATIDPRGVSALARSDPTQRLGDYRWALGLWTQCRVVDGLVFVENSGYDLDELRRIPEGTPHEGSTELLSFDGQDFPRELGKGYGETVNLEYTLANSRSLADPDTRILRVNGRNYVDNIGAFVEALRSTDILCDFRQRLTWGDGRVLGGTRRFFEEYVCPHGREVNDAAGYYFEHARAPAIHRGMADGLAWSPFPTPPHVRGYSGTSNTDNAESLLVRKGRELQHRLRLRMLRL